MTIELDKAVSIAVAILVIAGTLWKWLFKPHHDRVKALEHKAEHFMPKHEIHAAIDHEKENRRTALQAVQGQLNLHGEDIVGIKVAQGIANERQNSIAADVTDIRDMMKEHRRETVAGFDKVQDTLRQMAAPGGD